MWRRASFTVAACVVYLVATVSLATCDRACGCNRVAVAVGARVLQTRRGFSSKHW